MLTKLEAVNDMLDAIGEDPVDSLESGLVAAEKAEVTLDRLSKKIQAIGWSSNTELNTKLLPDEKKHIAVPETVLRVDTVGRDARHDVIVKKFQGQRLLYNRTTESFEFERELNGDVVWFYEFEDIDYTLQNYIAAYAARHYQKRKHSSGSVDALLKEEVEESFAALMDAEGELEDNNMISDNSHGRMIAMRNYGEF